MSVVSESLFMDTPTLKQASHLAKTAEVPETLEDTNIQATYNPPR